jgi:hypothetical protein
MMLGKKVSLSQEIMHHDKSVIVLWNSTCTYQRQSIQGNIDHKLCLQVNYITCITLFQESGIQERAYTMYLKHSKSHKQ